MPSSVTAVQAADCQLGQSLSGLLVKTSHRPRVTYAHVSCMCLGYQGVGWLSIAADGLDGNWHTLPLQGGPAALEPLEGDQG